MVEWVLDSMEKLTEAELTGHLTHRIVGKWRVEFRVLIQRLRAIQSTLTQSQGEKVTAERDAFREAFDIYARHLTHPEECASIGSQDPDDCTCGLTEALRLLDAVPTPPSGEMEPVGKRVDKLLREHCDALLAREGVGGILEMACSLRDQVQSALSQPTDIERAGRVTLAEAAHGLYENADPGTGMPDLWKNWDYSDPPSWDELNPDQKKWWRQMVVDTLHDYETAENAPNESGVAYISLIYGANPANAILAGEGEG